MYVSEIGPNMIWKFVLVKCKQVFVLLERNIQTLSIITASPDTLSHDLDSLLLPTTTKTTPTSSKSDNELDFWEELFRGHMSKATPTSNKAPPTSDRTPHKDPPVANASLPSDPYRGNASLADTDNDAMTANEEGAGKEKQAKDTNPFPVKNFGVFVAILVVALLVILVAAGVLKEHGTSCLRRRGKKVKVHSLHSLLGPSQLGFSRLRTYDSDSEADEFPVFNRV